MQLTDSIVDAWRLINGIHDWDDGAFSWPKARVSSIFAKVAYLHVPEFELKNAHRANLIPCAEYRERIITPAKSVLEDVLRGSDMAEFFVVERPYAVAVVVRVKSVVFISYRGTQKLYDWVVNLNALPIKAHPEKGSLISFHKGFYRAALSCMPEISDQIRKRFGEDVTVYVTGHSLGGALAAITHALWSNTHSLHWYWRRGAWRQGGDTRCCYTFGMPRYGNFHAVNGLESPFHISNAADIVPSVPPRLLGYDDVPFRIVLSDRMELASNTSPSHSFVRFLFHLATLKGIREHDMEIYLERVERKCDAS